MNFELAGVVLLRSKGHCECYKAKVEELAGLVDPRASEVDLERHWDLVRNVF